MFPTGWCFQLAGFRRSSNYLTKRFTESGESPYSAGSLTSDGWKKTQVIYVVPLQNPRARPWLDTQFSARFETTLHLFGRKQPTVQTGCFHSSSHHKSTFTFFNMEGKRYAHGINWYTKASCLPGYNLNQKILQWGEPLKWLIPTMNDTPSYKNKLGLQEGGWHPLICSTNWVIIYE